MCPPRILLTTPTVANTEPGHQNKCQESRVDALQSSIQAFIQASTHQTGWGKPPRVPLDFSLMEVCWAFGSGLVGACKFEWKPKTLAPVSWEPTGFSGSGLVGACKFEWKPRGFWLQSSGSLLASVTGTNAWVYIQIQGQDRQLFTIF